MGMYNCFHVHVGAVAGGQYFICYSVFKPLLNIGCWTWTGVHVYYYMLDSALLNITRDA